MAVILPHLLFAQFEDTRQNWWKDWRVGTIGGINYLATEIKKDFSTTSVQMNSGMNSTFGIHIDKRFTGNVELGIEFEKNYYYAEKTYPNKINWLIYDSRFNNETSHFVVAPIYSKSNTSTWFINVGYNLPNFRKSDKTPGNSNLFIKGGIGFTSIGVETGYIDQANYAKAALPDPFYEKGQGIHSLKDVYGSLHIGTGVNYYLSPRFSISGELLFLFVSNDYLDGVQNYEVTTLPNGTVNLNRQEVYSTIGEIRVSISYHFNAYRKLMSNGLWDIKYEKFENKLYHNPKDNKPEMKDGTKPTGIVKPAQLENEAIKQIGNRTTITAPTKEESNEIKQKQNISPTEP